MSCDSVPSCAAPAEASPVEQQTEEFVRALVEQALCHVETELGTTLPPLDDFEYDVVKTKRCYNTKVSRAE